MKLMRAAKGDVIDALSESMLEVRNAEGSVTAVRRPENRPLPALQEKATSSQFQKKKPHAHDGGAIVLVKDIPEEQTWMQVKDHLRTKLPEKVGIMFASSVSDKNQCVVAVTPFDGDLQLLEGLALEVGGSTLKAEVCYGDLLQQALKLLPKGVRERREKLARQRQKERQRPIVLANQRFPNIGAVRGRVKTILSSRSDGEQLNPEGSDYKLVHAILQYHPRCAEKMVGMTGIKIDESSHGSNRCFWIVRGENSEDFSASKCLAALELDPPYETSAPPKSDAASPKDAAVPASTEAKVDGGTPALVKKDSAASADVKVNDTAAKDDAARNASKEDIAAAEAKKASAE